MPFNPLQNFNQGFASGERQKISGLQSALAGQMQQGDFNPSTSNDFMSLSALDPQRASQMMNTFKSLSKDRKVAYHEDLQGGLQALEQGDGNKFLSLMGDRLSDIEKLNGDPSGTQFLLDKFNEGDIEGLITGLKAAEQAGIQGGFLSDPLDREIKQAKVDDLKAGGGLSSEARSFNKMLEDLTPKERSLAKRIKLGLAPRAVGSSAQTISQDEQLTRDVAASEAAITAAKETSKLESQFKLKPKISKAVSLATAEASLVGAQNKEEKSNGKALKVYDTAFATLASALGEAHTGPIAGLMPALTSKAQMADGAVAMVLPTLKSVFREAGEGTFTDGDQKLLTDMAPTRRDNPETIKFKLNAIDAIVRAKLGSSPTQAAEATQTVEKQGGQIMTDANGNRAMVFPDGSFEEI